MRLCSGFLFSYQNKQRSFLCMHLDDSDMFMFLFVQVIGHGMTNSLLDQVHSIGRDFFALPLEEKRKCLRTAEGSEGYGNASAHSDQIHNWSDRLYLTTSPEDQRKLKFWPQNPENFRYCTLLIKKYRLSFNS